MSMLRDAIDRGAMFRRRMPFARRNGSRFGGRVARWTPRMLPAGTLKLWLRADLGVTNDGSGYCSVWSDQSGNGYSFTQVTPSSRPAITTYNGVPCLSFDGTDDSMGSADAASVYKLLHDGSGSHVFIVMHQNGGASKDSAWLTNVDSAVTTDPGFLSYTRTTTFNRIAYHVNNTTATRSVDQNVNAVVSDNANHVLEYTLDSAASTKWEDYVDGSLKASNTSFAAALASGSNPTYALRIGRDRGAANMKAQGYCFEIIICNSVLSGANLTNMRAYMGARYGVTMA